MTLLAERKRSNGAAGTSSAPTVVVFEDPSKRYKKEREMEKAAAAKEKEKERKEAAAKAEERPDFGDLRALKREIHDFGSKAFDKKTGKRDKIEQMAKLGIRPPPKPRIPAKIGFGMAKAQKEREAKALEEMYESGMLKRKGTGQKKKKERNAARDKGLMELPDFRDGMLKVKKTQFKEKRVGRIDFGKTFK